MTTKKLDMLLEAEVSSKGKTQFEKRYQEITGKRVSPGAPEYYQVQNNKWGTELRVYFNSSAMATTLKTSGVHVEGPRRGYKSGEYRYRFNNSRLWWKLIEDAGLRLGLN